jgi:predicted nucleic acid-binding protein
VDFVDTNVLIYAVTPATGEERKQLLAAEVLSSAAIGLSAQVVQEFYTQVTCKKRQDALAPSDAASFVESFMRFPVQPLTPEIIRAAISTHQRYVISYWDAAIIEAARELGCARVLTEDLSDGQDYGGVRVENPFRGC